MTNPTKHLRAVLARFWKRLTCRHRWTPVYHSYHCDKCDGWSYD